MRRIKDWILRVVVMGLEIGAHCGLCGRWMEHELIYRDYPISVCEKCGADYGIFDLLKSLDQDVSAIVGDGNDKA